MTATQSLSGAPPQTSLLPHLVGDLIPPPPPASSAELKSSPPASEGIKYKMLGVFRI